MGPQPCGVTLATALFIQTEIYAFYSASRCLRGHATMFRTRGMEGARDRAKRPLALFPGKLDRQKRPASGTAFALAISLAFVSELQATALRILLEAAGHAPGAIGATFSPTRARSPYRVRALAAREWAVLVVCIVAP
jgi:hypothetical protein